MIIVEGPDGAGKTTLVKQIVDTFSLKNGYATEIVQVDRGPREEMGTDTRQREYVYRALSTEMLGRKSTVEIYDRLYFSELAYGEVWRNHVVFDPQREQAWIRTMIQHSLNAAVIFCLPPLEVCHRNIQDPTSEQMEKVEETLPEIYDRYERMFFEGSLEYDYTTDSVFKVYDYIHKYLRRREFRTW